MIMLRLVGAGLIISSCGAFGMAMAVQYRREIAMLRQFIGVVEYMQREMVYHLSPLPELCRGAAAQTNGSLRKLLEETAWEMESQIAPDVSSCMDAAQEKVGALPVSTQKAVNQLKVSLGIFDLPGQQEALASVHHFCEDLQADLEANKAQRIRNYQTLWLCAGAALAILLV